MSNKLVTKGENQILINNQKEIDMNNKDEDFSLSLKYEQLLREKKDLENQLSISKTTNEKKISQLEQYYKDIIQERENQIKELKNNKTNNIKIDNIPPNTTNNLQNIIYDFISNTNKLLMDNGITPEIIEHISKNIENKITNIINEMSNFFTSKINFIEKKYEKKIGELMEENKKIKLEILHERYKAIDVNIKEKIMNDLIKGYDEQIKELKNIIESKDDIIKDEREKIILVENELKESKKNFEELQKKNIQDVFELRIKEDEIDTLVMIIEAIHNGKKVKFLHNLNRLSEPIKLEVENIISSYNFPKDKTSN